MRNPIPRTAEERVGVGGGWGEVSWQDRQRDRYEGHGRTDRLTHGLGRMSVLCYHPKRSLEGVVYLNNCDKRFNSQEDHPNY